MKRILISLLCAAASTLSLFAVKAYPGLITKTQSDGSIISFYIHGDESFNYKTTEDGYMLIENVQGIFEYADYSKQNRAIESTGIKAYNIGDRSTNEIQALSKLSKADAIVNSIALKSHAEMRKAKSEEVMQRIGGGFPLSGSPKSLVILVNFTDKKFTSPTAGRDYTRLLNEEGYSDNGGTGCAVDYFKASSFGQFSPEFVVVGPYTLPHEMRYYGENRSYGDARAGNMIVDACAAADQDIDFKEYDTNNDGKIDNIFVYYAGHNEAEGGGDNSVWPHRSIVVSPYEFDGVRLYDYACTSEFKGSNGTNMCGIGTFCHEFGHVLGLPDWYATDGSTHPTLEKWDIMDAGSYNNGGCTPPAYSSYERFALGWLKPKQLEKGGKYSLPALIESNEAYLVALEPHNMIPLNPSPKEYFLLENRQRIGADMYVPGTGLLITHVVFNRAKWDDNTPNNDPNDMGASIYCAFSKTTNPEYNTYPGKRNVTDCTFKFRNGEELKTPLTGIKEENGIIEFEYPLGKYPNIEQLNKIDNFIVDYGLETKEQVLEFRGTQLVADVVAQLPSRSDFKIRLHKENNTDPYTHKVTVKVSEDSTATFKLDVQYDPSYCTYDEFERENLELTCGSYELKLILKGQARKPILVKVPKLQDAKDISPYAFTASWLKDENATEYYLSVYSIENNPSSETEEFSDFDINVPKGWRSNFQEATNDSKSEPKAVYFTSSKDTLWTKEYMLAPSQIEFWIKAKNTMGTLFVEGKDMTTGKWTKVYDYEVSSSTRQKILTVDMENKCMNEFKIYYQTEVKDGGIAFDDFIARFDESIKFVLEDYAVQGDTTKRVWGLNPESKYCYKVKASDKDLEHNPPRYNNVTDYSRVDTITTLEGPAAEDRKLALVYNTDGSGTYTVFVPDFKEAYSVFVYTTDGRLVKVINSDTDTFQISGLINGNIYILKYAERGNLRRRTKVVKLYYSDAN